MNNDTLKLAKLLYLLDTRNVFCPTWDLLDRVAQKIWIQKAEHVLELTRINNMVLSIDTLN